MNDRIQQREIIYHSYNKLLPLNWKLFLQRRLNKWKNYFLHLRRRRRKRDRNHKKITRIKKCSTNFFLKNKKIKSARKKKLLNSLELSVIVFGLFGSTSPSGSMQMWWVWISGLICSGRLSNDGTTITTSPLLPLQSFSRWLAYWVGIELLNKRKRKNHVSNCTITLKLLSL